MKSFPGRFGREAESEEAAATDRWLKVSALSPEALGPKAIPKIATKASRIVASSSAAAPAQTMARRADSGRPSRRAPSPCGGIIAPRFEDGEQKARQSTAEAPPKAAARRVDRRGSLSIPLSKRRPTAASAWASQRKTKSDSFVGRTAPPESPQRCSRLSQRIFEFVRANARHRGDFAEPRPQLRRAGVSIDVE